MDVSFQETGCRRARLRDGRASCRVIERKPPKQAEARTYERAKTDFAENPSQISTSAALL